MTETVKTFFTFASLGTFAGASGAVIVVSNTIRKLFKFDSPWPGFLTALVVSFIGAYSSDSISGIMDILLVVLNGCLLFSSAAGIQEMAVSALPDRPMGVMKLQETPGVKWLSSWFR